MTYLLNKRTQLNNYFLESNSNGLYTAWFIHRFENVKLNKSIVIKKITIVPIQRVVINR